MSVWTLRRQIEDENDDEDEDDWGGDHSAKSRAKAIGIPGIGRSFALAAICFSIRILKLGTLSSWPENPNFFSPRVKTQRMPVQKEADRWIKEESLRLEAPNGERRTLMAQIDRKYFETDPLTCARSLIGCELVWKETAGRTVETEAYAEHGDQASHTFLRRGTREFIKINPPGTLYVYLNYGVHWLLNFLVKGGSTNGFVLIRALEPTDGCTLMKARRGCSDHRNLCSGPGKLTQALAIDSAFHGRDFFQMNDARLVHRRGDVTVEIDRRGGITKSAELDWRFLLADSRFVSIPKRKTRLRTN